MVFKEIKSPISVGIAPLSWLSAKFLQELDGGRLLNVYLNGCLGNIQVSQERQARLQRDSAVDPIITQRTKGQPIDQTNKQTNKSQISRSEA